MKRVKTRLRTTLGDAWLANLLLLILKSDLTKPIDKDAVIEAFNKMAHHRAPPPNLRAGSAPVFYVLPGDTVPHRERKASDSSVSLAPVAGPR
ncbi:unnamed protein product [Phytophthora fragariaefolia]|uniref:Unnamed protein product n=1 Tax=Phytophthora fragariaefolia TaxID=1490495 RepID=A0A9W6Y160_9STRA|nr:unnamed protein product [Phytophthora fragariaefolia]